MSNLQILFLGDIVGSSGRKILQLGLPPLLKEHSFELIIANGENAAHGFGLTPAIAKEIFALGVDVITGGNHTWDKAEVVQAMQANPQRILRVANSPIESPGIGATVVHGKSGNKIGIINLMGRIFMDPLDCPFHAAKRELIRIKQETPIVIVDLHAEATSEKAALGWFLDGEVSAVLGTHTHVQTADERILPKGTGFLTDAGMNGPLDSVIGMKSSIIVDRFVRKMPIRMEVAEGPGFLQAVIVTVDSVSGKCLQIQRVRRMIDWTH